MGVAASSLSVIGTSGTGLAAGHTPGAAGHTSGPATATPIKHLVVIFQENVSFDDYFATCPKAANPAGEPAFHAAPRTPNVNGLNTPLLAPNNPNSVQPFRLGRDQAETSDQDHSYTDEQKAFDSGLLDKFVETVGRGTAACADYGKPRAPLSRRAPA
jgi:phospholipase C